MFWKVKRFIWLIILVAGGSYILMMATELCQHNGEAERESATSRRGQARGMTSLYNNHSQESDHSQTYKAALIHLWGYSP
jgi:hypothetical protein